MKIEVMAMFILSDILPFVPEDDRKIIVDLFENAPAYITERSLIKTLHPGQTLISADQKADKVFIHLTGKLLGVDTFEPDIIYNFIKGMKELGFSSDEIIKIVEEKVQEV